MRSVLLSLRRATAVVVGAALVLVAASACTPSQPARVVVTPTEGRFDEPVTIRVSGLRPAEDVELTVRAADSAGVVWSATAGFTADRDGVLDTGDVPPSRGDYLDLSGSGLWSTLQPGNETAESFGWPVSGPAEFDVEARVGGRVVGSTTARRVFWARPATVRTFTVRQDGFSGTYVRPAVPAGRPGPAVLFVGGTGGGEPRYAADYLAARGIAALSIAYFAGTDLPPSLADIALESFDGPLRWLHDQPDVDPRRVWIAGVSAGSEAAELVAVQRPGLVHGLIAVAPSSVSHCSFTFGCPTPSWLSDRRPVPATGEIDVIEPGDEPRAVIPVERFPGPVLAVCGRSDLVWNSCLYAGAILQRRRDHHLGARDEILDYPEAGHGLILLAPLDPRREPPPDARMYGATRTANDRALADAWPKILEFLRTR